MTTTTVKKRKPAKRRTAPKPAGFTFPRRARFLAYLEQNPNASIRAAAEHVGVKRWQAKALIVEDPEFATKYRAARGTRRDMIRDEIWARAFDRQDPSSARLLLKLGEAELLEFKPRQLLEHTSADGTPIEIKFAFDPAPDAS